jgi:hypothetical protein
VDEEMEEMYLTTRDTDLAIRMNGSAIMGSVSEAPGNATSTLIAWTDPMSSDAAAVDQHPSKVDPADLCTAGTTNSLVREAEDAFLLPESAMDMRIARVTRMR